MARRSNKKSKDKLGLIQTLFESKVANIIIILNVAIFLILRKYAIDVNLIENLVLYPGNILHGKLWCLITSGFLHKDLTHLFANMLGVLVFTRVVERQLGFAKTLFIYFGALVISMLFATMLYTLVFHKNVAIIGASGAVMGVISAAMLLDPFYISFEMILPLPVMVKGWLFFYADLQGLMGGEKDGVSHLSHLFGFLSIAILVYFLSKKDKKLIKIGLLINIFSFIVLLLLKIWLASHNFNFNLQGWLT